LAISHAARVVRPNGLVFGRYRCCMAGVDGVVYSREISNFGSGEKEKTTESINLTSYGERSTRCELKLQTKMPTSGQTLPSHLYEEFTNSNETTVDDPESTLQNALSALAEQHDIFSVASSDDESLLNWLVHAMTTSDTETNHGKNVIPEKKSAEYEWWWGLRLIHFLLKDTELTPFEIHSIANDSIVFSEGSRTHYLLCLLLCARSLEQCPAPIPKRWKRWQSVICETIRHFQNCFQNGGDDGDLMLLLWANQIVPACLHAILQLPPEAYHVALLSALVGTTAELAASTEWGTRQKQSQLQLLSETHRTILDTLSEHDDTWVWLHPWREHEMQSSTDYRSDSAEEEDDDEEDSASQRKDGIVWWATQADCHESVAGMNTSWDDLGISVLAFTGFDNLPQAFSPVQTWKVWFPHVATLLKSVVDPVRDLLPLLFVQQLLEVIPEKAVSSFNPNVKTPDSPLETFQLLSNRILVQSRNDTSLEEKQKIRQKTDRIVSLMKALLDRYIPVQQIQIVKHLLIDCPHPGLRAKFLDFLRPLILEQEQGEASDLFWEYIGSFIEALSNDHLKQGHNTLVNVHDLIDNVEIHVGAISMVQLFALVNHRLPSPGQKWEGSMRDFHKILEQSNQSWTSDDSMLSPENCYRLNLLEGSLQQVLLLLDGGGQPQAQEQKIRPSDQNM
jgi:hypothetical protein